MKAMASMSPSPLPAPSETSTREEPAAADASVAVPPPVERAPVTTSANPPSPLAANLANAARSVSSSALVAPVLGAASGGSFGTWSEPKLHPESTGTVRDALRKLRRAHLSRVVRTVVAASVVLCIAAGASAAIRAKGGDDLEVSHASRVSMIHRDFTETFATTHDDGDRPAAAPARREPRRAPRGGHRSH
jgi:hypothetical protein